MNKIFFITGGARSGKSRLAVKLAHEYGKRVIFIATGTAGDKEMARRISLHKKSRPADWQTIEEPLDIPAALAKVPRGASAVIIDCLTLLICNHLMAGKRERQIEQMVQRMIAALKKMPCPVIIVSNEVGSGIIPANKLSRDFCDIAGKTNQLMASASDRAYAMFAGFPVQLK